MKVFIRNQVGQIVFPSNFFPRLDFSVFDSLPQLEAVIHRDFEAKAPTGTDLLARAESGAYASRFELLGDVALNLLWVDRFAITMYERQPTRSQFYDRYVAPQNPVTGASVAGLYARPGRRAAGTGRHTDAQLALAAPREAG